MAKNDDTNRNKIIDNITEKLEEIGKQIQQDKTLSPYDKAPQIDIVLDVLHFLQDYDENVKVLNEYWVKKRKEEKYKNLDVEDR